MRWHPDGVCCVGGTVGIHSVTNLPTDSQVRDDQKPWKQGNNPCLGTANLEEVERDIW